jgi:hypothetical protein
MHNFCLERKRARALPSIKKEKWCALRKKERTGAGKRKKGQDEERVAREMSTERKEWKMKLMCGRE